MWDNPEKKESMMEMSINSEDQTAMESTYIRMDPGLKVYSTRDSPSTANSSIPTEILTKATFTSACHTVRVSGHRKTVFLKVSLSMETSSMELSHTLMGLSIMDKWKMVLKWALTVNSSLTMEKSLLVNSQKISLVMVQSRKEMVLHTLETSILQEKSMDMVSTRWGAFLSTKENFNMINSMERATLDILISQSSTEDSSGREKNTGMENCNNQMEESTWENLLMDKNKDKESTPLGRRNILVNSRRITSGVRAGLSTETEMSMKEILWTESEKEKVDLLLLA